MFFDSMPKILYDSKGNGEVKVVTNLLKRVAVRTKIKTNALILDTYNVKNGETPESIADKLYDDPELHWVVLMVNDITDRYHQWPMYEQQFNTYVNEKKKVEWFKQNDGALKAHNDKVIKNGTFSESIGQLS